MVAPRSCENTPWSSNTSSCYCTMSVHRIVKFIDLSFIVECIFEILSYCDVLRCSSLSSRKPRIKTYLPTFPQPVFQIGWPIKKKSKTSPARAQRLDVQEWLSSRPSWWLVLEESDGWTLCCPGTLWVSHKSLLHRQRRPRLPAPAPKRMMTQWDGTHEIN